MKSWLTVKVDAIIVINYTVTPHLRFILNSEKYTSHNLSDIIYGKDKILHYFIYDFSTQTVYYDFLHDYNK